jgi:phosphoglycolate phosphatase-like HAD superfamily hydrolase
MTGELIFQIFNDFASELEIMLLNGKKPVIHQGILELLQKLHEADEIFLGLVTGNTQSGARIKLKIAGLYDFFGVGGYGDDAKNRNELPPLAVRRAEELYHREFDSADTWIIGDSIYDIRCARANDLRCLAVSTGLTGYEQLHEEKPDFLFENLADSGQIVKLLATG